MSYGLQSTGGHVPVSRPTNIREVLTPERIEKLRTTVQQTVADLVTDLLDYDRRDDEDLPADLLDQLMEEGHVTNQDLVQWFVQALPS